MNNEENLICDCGGRFSSVEVSVEGNDGEGIRYKCESCGCEVNSSSSISTKDIIVKVLLAGFVFTMLGIYTFLAFLMG